MDGPLIWSFVLLGIAIGIVAIEMFIPSGGLLGIAATGCVIGSIVVAFTVSLKWGFGMIVLVGMISPIIFTAIVRLWPKTPLGRIILPRVAGDPPPDVLPDDEHYQRLQSLLGKIGVAYSDLLPNGMIEIEGERFDAVCIGGVADSGTSIKVVRIEAGKIHVRPSSDNVPDSQHSGPSSESPLDQSIEDLGIESLEDPLA